MHADAQRVSRICQALTSAHHDAMVCSLPANVLMLTGYCPVVGTSIAISTADGRIVVLAPGDEEELAARGRADEVRSFEAASLGKVQSVADAIRGPLAQLLKELRLERAAIAHDGGQAVQPAPYVAIHLYGSRLAELLMLVLPDARLVPGDNLLQDLRAVKTAAEIDAIRLACSVAGDAFQQATGQIRAGMTEAEMAALFQSALLAGHPELHDAARLGGSAFCSSGPNSYSAYAAYQRSRGRRIGASEPILLHCNSHVNGWWTDITRNYCMEAPSPLQARIDNALMEARAAALAAIRPGASAAQVDRAAREILKGHGFGDAFKHPTGHGVGFAAIDHNARPRLHPRSPDILEEGMVFNVEPGVYLEGFGGMRHCDMVAVTTHGVRVLTPFDTGLGVWCEEAAEAVIRR